MLNQDLFGIWILTKYWGRRFSKLGGGKQLTLFCYTDHVSVTNLINQRRSSRGYQLVLGSFS
ncbi:MAG: hypothetical protein RI883_2139 [Bacteroidota bacterium]|jgi:hypothetical protein